MQKHQQKDGSWSSRLTTDNGPCSQHDAQRLVRDITNFHHDHAELLGASRIPPEIPQTFETEQQWIPATTRGHDRHHVCTRQTGRSSAKIVRRECCNAEWQTEGARSKIEAQRTKLVRTQGAIMKDVVLAEGIKVRTFSAPPPGFDPLTAPASVLAAHGFPPRPERQKQLALYTRFFSQLKSRFHYVEPSFRIGPRHGRIRVAPVAPAGPAVINPLWAGAQAAAPSQEAFYLVSANWTVPNISSFPGGGDQFYAWSWIGLSSFDVNTLGLFQIGLASDVSGQGASSSRSFKFFIEFFPADAVMLTNVPVGPGDTIGAVVFTDGAGAGEGGYVLANLTSGAATSGFLSAPDNITLGASDQALWVVERPTIGGSTSVLADYTQLFFSGCEGLCSGGGRYDLVGGGSGTVLTMADPDTTIWSNGVLVSDTVVECVYTGPRVW